MNYLIPLIVYVIVNVIVFAVYAIDKRKAVKQKWRIPESTLIILAVFGAIGATLAMLAAHHKTNKLKFKLVYLFFVLHIIGIVALIATGAITF